MKTVTKLQNLLKEENEARLLVLCEWIRSHCDQQRMTWEVLRAQSGFSHKDLITLFSTYLKTTPMAFVRQCKLAKDATGQAQQTLFLKDPASTD